MTNHRSTAALLVIALVACTSNTVDTATTTTATATATSAAPTVGPSLAPDATGVHAPYPEIRYAHAASDPDEVAYPDPTYAYVREFSYEPNTGPPGTTIKFTANCLWDGYPTDLFVSISRVVNEPGGEPYNYTPEFWDSLPMVDWKGDIHGIFTIPQDAIPGPAYHISAWCRAGDQAFGVLYAPFTLTEP